MTAETLGSLGLTLNTLFMGALLVQCQLTTTLLCSGVRVMNPPFRPIRLYLLDWNAPTRFDPR